MILVLALSVIVVSAVQLHVMKIAELNFSNAQIMANVPTWDVLNVVRCQTFQRWICLLQRILYPRGVCLV